MSPDGQRLASGGLDGKVRIWSTAAIYDEIAMATAVKSSNANQDQRHNGVSGSKQLCSMSTHTGAVTTVRFSPNSKYLASGSDDRVVLIWERDDSRVPRKEFGVQGEADTESWTVRKRLIGHDNDVQDLAWAPDSSILVTVGLDSSIIIWSGSTFEKLKRFDAHQSHVKGIAFDPANKYFATASDDRTVRIIRYQKNSPTDITFSIEHTISSPFEGSPLSTYFRRLSWSPDGNHIAAANATNGPVTTVAIINRGTWDSEISLIGHEAPCEVASFCPRVFTIATSNTHSSNSNSTSTEKEPKTEGEKKMITVVATAGQDKSLAIWNTSNSRPLLVACNISDKAISDITWTSDGSKLFASSLDGTVLVASFEDGELGYALSPEEVEQQLTRYGGKKDENQMPESVEQLILEEKITENEKLENIKKMDQIMGGQTQESESLASNGGFLNNPNSVSSPTDNSTVDMIAKSANISSTTTPAITSSNRTSTNITKNKKSSIKDSEPANKIQTTIKTSNSVRPVQKITITKDGKKRVAPQLLTAATADVVVAPTSLNPKFQSRQLAGEPDVQVLELSKPSHALPKGGVSALVIGTKRKLEDEEGSTEGETPSVNKKAKSEPVPDFIRPAIVSPASTVSQVRLAVPKVRTFFVRNNSGEDNSGVVLEIRNGSGNEQEPTKVIATKRGQVVFMDFLPRYGHLAAGQADSFWAVSTEDGVLYLYSPSGRKLMPSIVLGSPVTFLESQGPYLLAVTSTGMIHLWNIRKKKKVFPAVSLAPILDSGTKVLENGLSRAPSVTQCGVSMHGKVIFTLSNGQGFTYDSDMESWHRISESWWTYGSQYWDSSGFLRGNMEESSSNFPANSAAGGGLVALMETRTNDEVIVKAGGRGRYLQRLSKNRMMQEGYEGFEGVISISHLENRIGAAIMLNSASELEMFLIMYTRRIAEEGMKDRMNELCQELLGPVISIVDDQGTANSTDGWQREWCGIDKHELLKKVVLTAGKFREVQQVILDYARAVGVVV